MHVTVKKWGNSASVRIPAAVMKAAGLRVNETVDVREEQGRIVIEPIRPRKYVLSSLLAGVTDQNIHGKAGFGPVAGKEAF